jgi:beta-xylosidase
MNRILSTISILLVLNNYLQLTAQNSHSKVWVADNGDGTYTNPILHADYSDPDVIRVGEDFYLISSSFNYVPGIPVLHSKDLVNWSIVGHVFSQQIPLQRFNSVQHGGGVWAPSIRYNKGEFYIYYSDPDEGIYMVKAKNASGPWNEPILIKKVKGWIDPCPFWDDDGRSGMKSTLILNRMSNDGTKLLDNGVIIFDGHATHPTVEGPKMYKRNGFYYILAPAGGVGKGWQLALRSKNIYGPYDDKIVLEQGKTNINGPHQGALVDTPTGENWFIHFQDKDAYGRILHLQPVNWVNDWPQMGVDKDGNGIGEPVMTFRKPNGGKTFPINTPEESDEFNNNKLGLQWQWGANPQSNYSFPAGTSYGFLRMYCVPAPDSIKNLWSVCNILTQKFPAPNFTATTKLTLSTFTPDEEAGLIVTGIDYAYLSLKKNQDGLMVFFNKCLNAESGNPEQTSVGIKVQNSTAYFRVNVKNIKPGGTDFLKYNNAENSPEGNSLCTFSYSFDNVNYQIVDDPFAAKKGKWVGAKVGIFAIRKGKTYETGYADFDWFRIEKQ